MADLTVTITEDLTINSAAVGGSNTKTITGINDVYKRTTTCQNGQATTIATFAAQEYTTDGALDLGDVKYLRITNLDSTNGVELAFILVVGESQNNYQITLKSGETYMLHAAEEIAAVETDGAPAFGTLNSLESIQVKPIEAADVRVELFVASI